MRISDWSSDVCSSDLQGKGNKQAHGRFSRWFDARLANRREKSTIWLPAPETGVGRARAVERAFAAPPSVAAAFDEQQARPFGAAAARRKAKTLRPIGGGPRSGESR